MSPIPVTDVLIGVYLGVLAGIFPAFVAFSIGFGFKYFTDVTIPGLGVVVLGGGLAGVSGGLMGLVDPTLAETWTGPTAVLVILMACLWAHNQGDKLGAATPRRLTLRSLRNATLSTDLVERIDSFGQARIRQTGAVQDLEGYPPLPDDLRERLTGATWTFPANLPLSDLEARLEARLRADHELAEASVSIDTRGRAQIAAAPSAAGLSRRVPEGTRAVSIRTVLPTGVARGDLVTVRLPDGGVTGPVVSARTAGVEATVPTSDRDEASTADEAADDEEAVVDARPHSAARTTGGEGTVTVALPLEAGRRVVRTDFAGMTVHSRGKQREFESIGVLREHGDRFRSLTLSAGSSLAGRTIGDVAIRDAHGVAVLAIKRAGERVLAPRGESRLEAGDTMIVVGKPDRLDAFEGVAT